MIGLVISTSSGLAQPIYFGKLIGISAMPDEERDRKMRLLNRYSLTILVLFLISGISSFFRGWLFTLIGERIVWRIRQELFQSIVKQDIKFFDENKTGELMNRLSSDTAKIQSCLSVNISEGLRSSGQVLLSIVLLSVTSWKLTLAVSVL